MTFPSLIFLFLFLPCALGLYIVVKQKVRKVLLLLFSLFFYAWGGIGNACLLLLFVCMVYALGRYIGSVEKKRRARRLTESILLLVVLLFYYKYYGFFLDTVFAVLSVPISYEVLPMPPGISFITFTAMAYLIDIRREVIRPVSFLQVAVYLTFFPKLIMGPIERYDVWAGQLKNTWQPAMLEEGAIRFLMGLSQKLLLADALAPLWSYTSTHSVSMASAWLGLLAYTFQIYFDFQGYMNMAIGLGRMFGIRLQENFDHPYTSTSITDFWRRWHRTLGSWFRDYVYIPLGGNRKGLWRTLRNLMLVWGLTGFWHGASWTFLLWGLYYGILLILEKFVLHPYLKRLPSAARMMLTFAMVMLGWVLFASDGLSQAVVYYRQLFTTTHGVVDRQTLSLLVNYGFWLCAAAVFSTRAPLVVSSNLMYALRDQQWFLKPVLTIVVFVILLSCLMSAGYQSFLYVQF